MNTCSAYCMQSQEWTEHLNNVNHVLSLSSLKCFSYLILLYQDEELNYIALDVYVNTNTKPKNIK